MAGLFTLVLFAGTLFWMAGGNIPSLGMQLTQDTQFQNFVYNEFFPTKVGHPYTGWMTEGKEMLACRARMGSYVDALCPPLLKVWGLAAEVSSHDPMPTGPFFSLLRGCFDALLGLFTIMRALKSRQKALLREEKADVVAPSMSDPCPSGDHAPRVQVKNEPPWRGSTACIKTNRYRNQNCKDIDRLMVAWDCFH